VGVILVAHSMGGFVASDALFSILDNCPISPSQDVKLMFPLIQGILAFDTPYNGLSRSMFAYGAFSQYRNLSSIWSLYSTVSSFGAGLATSQITSTQGSSWARWGALASRTGTYGAIITGGAMAYANRAEIAEYLSKFNRQSISQSWSKVNKENISEGLAYVSRDSIGEGFAWMSGHLKFVGALMKQAQLATRLERLHQMKGIGLVNIYASLGDNGYWSGGYFIPKRTFCAIPSDSSEMFREQPNSEAENEIQAHCSMFQPEKNSSYENMAKMARDLVVQWLENDPRKVVDDYKPDQIQLSRRNSEANLFDDDGKILGRDSSTTADVSDDASELQAILESNAMPQPADGGISDEDLARAAAVPLPPDVEEKIKSTSWRSKLPANPLTMTPLKGVSLPSISLPKVPSWKSKKVDGVTAAPADTVVVDDERDSAAKK